MREVGARDPATARMILPRGKRVPKVLPDIFAYQVVRSKVVEQMQDAGVTGYRAHLLPWEMEENGGRVVPITEDLASKLPTYYFLEIRGGVDIDLFERDHEQGAICPGCGLRGSTKDSALSHPRQRYVPAAGTWDGSDWCRWRNLIHASPLCSRKVINLAARNRWTNFLFGESLPGVSIYSPVPEDWFPPVAQRVRELHADLFV